MKQSRLESLDFLRGCAALAVVFYHAVGAGNLQFQLSVQPIWFQAVLKPFGFGNTGVALFFVVSGFCIHLKWTKNLVSSKQNPDLHFVDFWKRRFYRLYPPYVISLTISMLIVVMAYLLGRSDVNMLNNYPGNKTYWIGLDYIAHLTMLHGFHPALDHAGGNAVYWTLAREEYLYLLYFPLLALRRTRGLFQSFFGVVIIGILCTFCMNLVVPTDSAWGETIKSSAIALWVQWCLGMVSVEAHYGVIKIPKWCYWVWLSPLFGALSVASQTFAPLFSPILWGLTFFILLNFCIKRETEGRWKTNRIVGKLSRIGIWSYSLYLVHLPIQAIIGKLLIPGNNGISPLVFMGYFLLLVIVSCVTGWMFFCLVERHFLTPLKQNTKEGFSFLKTENLSLSTKID